MLAASAAPGRVPVVPWTLVKTYPHDPIAFTEGLLYRDGVLYESTGLEGQSDIRRVRLADGQVLARRRIDPALFGEGIVDNGGELVSLTWRSGAGFRWRLSDFKPLGRFSYPGEGWGMTRGRGELVMSDGTPELRFLDPQTLKERRRLTVTADGRPVANLNELEWVGGEILANVWQTPLIARIDPVKGTVTGWIDLSPLLARTPAAGREAGANGIAWDAKGKRLFVTGKRWPSLYEIRLGK